MITYISPLGPDATSGGVRKLYDHVDILNARGFRAQVMLNDAPASYGPNDLLVIPEIYGDLLRDLHPGVKRISLNQNAHNTWSQVRDMERHPYVDNPDLLAVLTVSEHNRRLLQWAFPDLRVERFYTSIARPQDFYFDPEAKRDQLCYFGRKRAKQAQVVLGILEARRALGDWDVIQLDGLSDEDVGRTMRESKIFLSFGELEGYPAPPLEALACGCWVVGFAGYGSEPDDQAFLGAIPDDDCLDMAKTVEAQIQVDRPPRVPPFLQDESREREVARLLELFGEFVERDEMPDRQDPIRGPYCSPVRADAVPDSRERLRSTPDPICFERADIPRVSIVVLGWKSAPCLIDCLRSIAENVVGVAYEVVVALNAPADSLLRGLTEGVTGAVLVTSHANRGFSGGCNMGVARSRGEYLVLLNDDTEVMPGWLEALVETADAHPNAGAVGGMVLNPDGSLQEAGALVWNDGCAAAVGGAILPSDMSVLDNIRRVDFCGGEALLVRRATWDAVGGLSEDYYPAYYEDVDLCFKIAARGEMVLFQPAAKIYHLRGHSTNRRFQDFLIDRSRRIFVERWREVLSRRTDFKPHDHEATLEAIGLAAQPHDDSHHGPGGSDLGQVVESEVHPNATTGHTEAVEIEWLRRERAMRDEYTESLERAVEELGTRIEELTTSVAMKDADIATTRAQIQEILTEVGSSRDELQRTRDHLSLVENRVSYRMVNRTIAALQRYPRVFGLARKLAGRVELVTAARSISPSSTGVSDSAVPVSLPVRHSP